MMKLLLLAGVGIGMVAGAMGAPTAPASFIQMTGNACATGENGVGVRTDRQTLAS